MASQFEIITPNGKRNGPYHAEKIRSSYETGKIPDAAMVVVDGREVPIAEWIRPRAADSKVTQERGSSHVWQFAIVIACAVAALVAVAVALRSHRDLKAAQLAVANMEQRIAAVEANAVNQPDDQKLDQLRDQVSRFLALSKTGAESTSKSLEDAFLVLQSQSSRLKRIEERLSSEEKDKK